MNGASDAISTLLRPVRQQDADLRGTVRRSELGARVVVGEDLVVRPAVLGEPVRAVLGHPDAVAPAEPGDHEYRCRAGTGPASASATRARDDRDQPAHRAGRGPTRLRSRVAEGL